MLENTVLLHLIRRLACARKVRMQRNAEPKGFGLGALKDFEGLFLAWETEGLGLLGEQALPRVRIFLTLSPKPQTLNPKSNAPQPTWAS